jgi:hypothetical protein
MEDAASRYAALAEALEREPQVVRNAGKGFGAGGLMARGKLFACLTRDQALLLKLPSERVAALIGAGDGRTFEPRPGRVMSEWVVVGADSQADWMALAREALAFAQSSRR